MSNEKRVAEKNLGLFSNDPADGSGGFLVPMDNLNVGPGKPGPGDEWHVPVGPVETEDDADREPAQSDGRVVSPLRPTKKR